MVNGDPNDPYIVAANELREIADWFSALLQILNTTDLGEQVFEEYHDELVERW